MFAELRRKRILDVFFGKKLGHRIAELTMKVNFGLFCCLLVSLLRYSHDGVRTRKGEEGCLQFLVVNSVRS